MTLKRITRCGMTLPGNGSRLICGLSGLTGFVGSKLGLGLELKGLKIVPPLLLKLPLISS